MNESQNNIRVDSRKKPIILDYLAILVRGRKFILLNFFGVALIAAIISLVLPSWYSATVSILPPKEQNALNPLGAASTMLRGVTAANRTGLLNRNTGSYNYFAILKSRSSLEMVIRKFDLMGEYGIRDSSMEKTIAELRENVSFDVQEDENITIEVLDKDPRKAAEMANYFVDVLNKISIELGTLEARDNRTFIEKRLEQIKADLRNAEDSLRRFQERSSVIITPAETGGGFSAAVELYAMKAKKEIEIAILERTATKDNDVLKQLKLELEEIDRKISTIPQVSVEGLRFYRDVLILQKIVEYLIPMYEQAKIDEQKDVPVILVLDHAVASEKKAKPKRSLIVLSASFTSFLLTVLFLLGRAKYQFLRTSNPDLHRRIKELSLMFRKLPPSVDS